MAPSTARGRSHGTGPPPQESSRRDDDLTRTPMGCGGRARSFTVGPREDRRLPVGKRWWRTIDTRQRRDSCAGPRSQACNRQFLDSGPFIRCVIDDDRNLEPGRRIPLGHCVDSSDCHNRTQWPQPPPLKLRRSAVALAKAEGRKENSTSLRPSRPLRSNVASVTQIRS